MTVDATTAEIAALRVRLNELETVGRLEAQLVAAKEAGATDTPEYTQLKHDLREARRVAREAREAVEED